ncbi:hypothetical protein PI125_g22609 [Phytophthora idaei]|nr:hypothetical protein PI125_g22609 [Phytophthora idaei]
MGSVAIVSGVGIGVGSTADTVAAQTGAESAEMAFFTNPQGVYNKHTGTWEVPGGRFWNGRYWQPNWRSHQSLLSQDSRAGGKRGNNGGDRRARVHLAQVVDESSEESESDEMAPPPQQKRRKGAVKKTTAGTPPAGGADPRVSRWPMADSRCAWYSFQNGGKRGPGVVRGSLRPTGTTIPREEAPSDVADVVRNVDERMDEYANDEWLEGDGALDKYPKLVAELAEVDGLCEQLYAQAVEVGGEQNVASGDRVKSEGDESREARVSAADEETKTDDSAGEEYKVAAVRMVGARLLTEAGRGG